MFSSFNRTTGCITFGSSPAIGSTVNIIYPYQRSTSFSNIDIRGNSHVDLDRLAELQKLVAKHPNRTDLKMELMKLQSKVKPKIGKRKKKK